MANTVVVGAQWGDEAKGKIVDYLAQSAEMVVRYGGGSNAGHTVTVGEETYKFHLIPCGILNPEAHCIIADAVVVDPEVLVNEIEAIEARGHSTSKLRISSCAHVVMPYHKQQDLLDEQRKGADAIGTTGRGIGPAYADKASRIGIRMNELIDPTRFADRLKAVAAEKNAIFTQIYKTDPIDVASTLMMYEAYAEKLKPYVAETSSLVAKVAGNGRKVIFEGAQGTLLDLDMGTYPFVTSSHPIAGGACLGTGVGPRSIDEVWGVAKAYTTRVGAGIFPTELLDATGEYIREKGREYGTTTGRPRRCGWLDSVILRYSARVNGLTGICLGLLDVLGGLESLKICVAYSINGERTEDLPCDLTSCSGLEPIYEELPGWQEDISGARSVQELPVACLNYIQRVEQLSGVPVVSLSVGPSREQTIPLV